MPSNPLSGNFTNTTSFHSSLLVNGGYLIRSARVVGDNVYLTGDFNRTTNLEVIGTPSGVKDLFLNGKSITFEQDSHDVLKAKLTFETPDFSLPDLSKTKWKKLDSLPEITSGMNFPLAIHPTMSNVLRLQ